MTQTVKNLPAIQETQGQPLGWEDPLEKGMPTQRRPAGYSPCGCKDSDTTEAT